MIGKGGSNIRFHELDTEVNLTQRKKLKLFLANMFIKERARLESIQYIFCSDAYLLNLNKDYLGHDTFTDIITFRLSDPNKPIIGEIYISLDRVKENATLFHTSGKKELHRVIFHGVLHLCGYKDKSKSEQVAMRIREDHYLASYFVSRETKR